MTPVPIAFYAPLKSPDHPNPSGDRTMARLLLCALEQAGFAPEVASRLRTLDSHGDAATQRRLFNQSLAEADRLTTGFEALPAQARPQLWFTYHNYYKAPDYLGPEMSRRLGVPYFVAEASRASKRADGPWAFAHRAVETGLDQATALFVMTQRDRDALERGRPAGQGLIALPPFLDASEWAFPREARTSEARSPTRLLTVAMMRTGDKLASYRLLAEGLDRIASLDWTLDIVGDGPARSEIEGMFARFEGRVSFAGRLGDNGLARRYAAADVFVWPAVNEAYGMALLEAQANGCPVVAGGYGGVADAMRSGVTGLMPRAGDVDAFANALASLIADSERRAAMGRAARHFILDERDILSAARILRSALQAYLPSEAVECPFAS